MMAEKIRVLYVDDESALLELGKQFLERFGDFTVTTVIRAPEAIRLLEKERFDAIISDYQMPEMDGIEFVKVLRARGDKTPFIIFTGKGREDVVIQALNCGVDFYLQKGGESKAQFAELAHKVQRAVSLRQTKEALQESEIKFRDIFNNTTDAIHIHEMREDGTPGKFTEVNDVACRMLGYTREELLKKTPLDITTGYHSPPVETIFEKQRTAGSVRFETEHRRKDGTIIPVEVNTHMVTLQGKNVMLAVIRDITERKASEQALIKSQIQLAEAMDLAHIANWEFDVASGLFTFNDRFYTLYGTTAEREGGYQMPAEVYAREFVHPDEAGVVADEVQNAITATDPNYTRNIEHRIIRRDGEIRHIIVRFGITKDARGITVKTHGANQDITDRKRAEESLRKSEERYRAIVEDQTEFVCRFTPDGRLTFVNDAYCRYFDLDKDRCLARPHFVLLPPEDAQMMKQHLTSLTLQNPVATIEHRIIMPSGEVLWQRWNDRAIFNENGNVVEYQSVGRDITEIKNAEKSLLEREAYYRAIFENTGTASVIVEEDTTISLANEEFVNLCGYSREEIEGKKRWTEFVVKEDLERMLAQHRLRRKDGKKAERHYEFRFVRKSGEVRTIYLSIDVISGTNKSIAALLDITEYTEAEQALRESEARLSLAMDVGNAGVWEWNLESDEVHFDARFHAILGYNPGELPTTLKEWLPYHNPVDVPVWMSKAEAYLRGDSPVYESEHRIRTKAGDWAWVFTRGRLMTRTTTGSPKRFIGFAMNVTERKLTEDALRESEARFRTVVEQSPFGIQIMSPDGRTLQVNKAFEELWGLVLSDLKDYNILRDDEIVQLGLMPFIQKGFSGETVSVPPAQYDVRHLFGKGEKKWVQSRIYPLKDATGKIRYVILMHEDITDRKRAEEALRIAHEKYTKVFLSAPDAITISELDSGRFIEVNDVATRIFGYSRDELMGKSALELGIWQNKEDRDGFIDQIRKHGRVSQFEVLERRKSGELYNALVNADTLSIGNISCLIATIRDITESKQVEEALRESENRFRNLVEATSDWVWEVDENGHYTYASPKVLAILGYNPDELLGKTPFDLMPPEEAARIGEIFSTIVASHQPFSFLENINLHKDGHKVILDTSGVPVFRPDGTFCGYRGIDRDVTERKRVEGAVQAAVKLTQLVDTMSVSESMAYTLDEAERLTNSKIGFFHFVNPDERTIQLITWSTETKKHCFIPKDPERNYPVSKAGVWVDCLRERKPVIHNDYANLPHKKGLPKGHVPVIRELVVPIFDEDKIVAIIGVGNKATDYDEKDTNVLTLLAKNAWTLIQRKQAEEEREKIRLWQSGVNRILESVLTPVPLDQKLKMITDGVVETFGADFCRIWLIEKGDLCTTDCMHAEVVEELHACRYRDKCLHLKASSGRYTHIDGKAHRRVPFGAYKIGRIASGEETKFLTNDVEHDPRVHDHAWAKSLGLVAFSGYRLKPPDGEVLGVFALFTRFPISLDMDVILDGLSRSISLAIQKEIADKALRESEDRYRTILEQATDAVFIHDETGRIIDANRKACQSLGYSREELLSKSIGDIDPDAIQAEKDELWGKVIAGEHFTFESRQRRKDGGAIPVEVSLGSVHLPDRRVIIGTVRDITDRKSAEEEERLTRERFETLVKVSEMRDASETELSEYVMEAACRMTGSTLAFIGTMTPDESVMDLISWSKSTMQDCRVAVSPLHFPVQKAGIWADAIRTQKPKIVNDYSAPHPGKKGLPEGHVRITRFLSLPILDNGKVVMVAAVANKPNEYDDADVTRLTLLMQGVWGNLQRRRSEETLKKSEERYRVLFEESPISLWEEDFSDIKVWIDTKTNEGIGNLRTWLENHPEDVSGCAIMVNVTHINRATMALFGVASYKQFSEGLSKIFTEDSYDAFKEEIIAFAEGKNEFEGEVTIQTLNGERKIIFLKAMVVLGYEQTLSKILVSIIDITDLKRVEGALRQANRQLNILSSITRHDILNQLLALKGYLELSQDIIDNPDKLSEFIKKEEQAANTIERQITFTRDYQELGVAAPAWQNVNANIQKAIAGLPMRDVRVEVDRTDLEIYADRLFEKVFYNLIDNALKYGGERMKTIRVSSQESDNHLVIVCEDDGVGITDEDKKKLFRKGFGKHTGLGLFLSREILAITGITITENGIPGKGARFEITVPKGAYRFTGTEEK